MKTNKIIGLLVGIGGVVASFAAAAALYVKGVDPVGFGIGAQYHAQDGAISYKINGLSTGTVDPSYLKADGSNGGEGFGGLYTQALYEFPVTATYSRNAQDYVVGNFAISLTGISGELHDHAHVWAEVKGFGDEYYSTEEGHTDHIPDNSVVWGSSAANVKFMNSDALITGETFSVNKDIVVETSGTQKVCVYVKLDAAVAESAMLNLAETTPFSISVTWGAPSAGYEGAYAIGDGSNWQFDELYAMVPNMKNASFQWYYKGLTGWTAGKAVFDEHDGEDVWSANISETQENAELDASKTYNVYWDGSGSSIANYYEQ